MVTTDIRHNRLLFTATSRQELLPVCQIMDLLGIPTNVSLSVHQTLKVPSITDVCRNATHWSITFVAPNHTDAQAAMDILANV